jgi:hypothetical protein
VTDMKQILLMIVAVVMVGCGGGLDGYYVDTKEFVTGGFADLSLDIELSSDGSAFMYVNNRGSVDTREGKYSVSGDVVSIKWDRAEDGDVDFYTLSASKEFLEMNEGNARWRGEKR